MKKTLAVLSLGIACAVGVASAQNNHPGHIKRVLLISVDGMHAVDYLNCAKGVGTVNNGEPYCPALAALGKKGVNYVAASTSKPSDSFPGLTAIITGGSPALTGVYYDVAYSRNFDARRKPPATAWRQALALPIRRPRVPQLSMKKGSTSTRPW
jgi:predicted AlkP superfamily pyrophosphatase or phosphodiesterase